MKFPGRRKSSHYFPVTEHGRIPLERDYSQKNSVYIVGIEQLIVDVEVRVTDDYLAKYGITKGQSMILGDSTVEEIYSELLKNNQIVGEYAGGAIGNTLHNYSVLADDASVCLATVCETLTVGSYAFKYITSTSSHVDFSYLQPRKGQMARAICFVTPDGERSFGLGLGIMNELSEDYIPEDVIKNATALLITTFLLRDEKAPLYAATMKAVKIAKAHNVPIVLSMGTSFLVKEKLEFFRNFIKDYVSIVAMNEQEALAFVGETDPLLAGEKALDYTDLALITVGSQGLYLCGYVDKANARETKDKIHSKSIPEYNRFEYSRAQLKSKCVNPMKIYTHINPYMGGPGRSIRNTNGAGDAALSALLHDVASNLWHRVSVPTSPKHRNEFLTYSSLHQVSKYANRVSYEILRQNSPRLTQGLPIKEDNLEESYWDK